MFVRMSLDSAHDLSLRYPIGDFSKPAEVDAGQLDQAIAEIGALPAKFRAAFAGLTKTQLETPYREGGWRLRQVAHHVADSHMNAYVRMRLALTEDWPTIKPYAESKWAELADARTLPVEVSLALLEPLHQRLVVLLESLGDAEWARGYVHPAMGRQSLREVAMLYSWHGRHHTAHVTGLRTRMGW
jgi:hypothetical protein